jgi:hypothetical protein
MPGLAAVELVEMDFVVLESPDPALAIDDVALEIAFPTSDPELVVATPPQAETSKRDVIDSIKPTLNCLSIMLAVLYFDFRSVEFSVPLRLVTWWQSPWAL